MQSDTEKGFQTIIIIIGLLQFPHKLEKLK